MVEVHGWITLRYSDYHSVDAEQDDYVYRFKQFILKHCDWVLDEQLGSLTRRNGLDCFVLNVQHNHPGAPFYPLDIFTWAAENSTASYGILYFYDEGNEAYQNEFQVFVLKRGKLMKEKDHFLSPYFEEVEKEYDENNPPQD
jgi:hypothetical protein